jgi:hypothetical protein
LLAQLFNDEREEAVVNANFIFDGGRREKAMFAVIKEDGKWKVFAFQSGND